MRASEFVRHSVFLGLLALPLLKVVAVSHLILIQFMKDGQIGWPMI